MARKLTNEKAAEILALRTLPLRDIAKRVGVSLSTVHAVLRRPVAEAPAPEPVAAADPPPSDEEDDTPIETRLARTLASLERAASAAETSGDVARIVAAQRAATQALALAHRLTPPPAPDPNERPDMRALAETAEKRLEALIADLLRLRESWPACRSCGCHPRPHDFQAQLDGTDTSRAIRLIARLL